MERSPQNGVRKRLSGGVFLSWISLRWEWLYVFGWGASSTRESTLFRVVGKQKSWQRHSVKIVLFHFFSFLPQPNRYSFRGNLIMLCSPKNTRAAAPWSGLCESARRPVWMIRRTLITLPHFLLFFGRVFIWIRTGNYDAILAVSGERTLDGNFRPKVGRPASGHRKWTVAPQIESKIDLLMNIVFDDAGKYEHKLVSIFPLQVSWNAIKQ